jgi:hypothetical protein
MTDLPTPIDGAIVRFLLRVIERFEASIADPDLLLVNLRAMGLNDDAVARYRSFLTARANDIETVSEALPQLLEEVRSSDPDLFALIAPVKQLWAVITGIISDAPQLSAADMPMAPGRLNGDILGQLITSAADQILREEATALWVGLSASGFMGPGASILSAVQDGINDPFAYVWERFKAFRQLTTLSVAGLLTGPRIISASSARLGSHEGLGAEAIAAFGADKIVLQRVLIKLAADTYDDPTEIMLDIVGTDTAPPDFTACVLSVPAIAAPLNIGSALKLKLDPFNAPFALAFTGFGSVQQVAGNAPKITLSANTPRTFRFGSQGGIRVDLGEPIFEATASADGWGATLGAARMELVIPKSEAGDILGIFLPDGGIALRGKLLFAVDQRGFHFDGGVGLSIAFPDVVRLPGITIHTIKTSIAVEGSNFPVSATGTILVSLGPLTVTMEGFGITLPLRLTADGTGNLGIVDLPPPGFAKPTGLGVALDAKIVKGGGFLRVTETEIAGALELALVLGPLELSIQAFGIIEEINGELSFIVIMSATFSPPIEIFLGLTLNAVGGVFGFQRTVDTSALTSLVREGRAKDVLIPDDLVARAPEILKAVATTFPAKSDQYVAGPMLQLGWGRPVSIVTMTAGILFTFPKPVAVIIIGQLRVAIPAPEAAIIDLRASFAGIINATTGDVSFDASLTNSRIGLFDVSGDLALRAGPQGFVFTVGGFHPLFTPPADLATIRRISISLSPSPLLKMWAEAYFAVTASSLQFGAGLYLEAKLGPIGAKGHVSLDTLIRTAPKLHFIVTISGEFQLIVAGEDIASMSLRILLEGPGRWRARAHASISILFFSISGTLELEWGQGETVLLGPPVDVADKVREALVASSVWTHVLPATGAGSVQLRSGATALHPLGLLRLTQTAAPLGVPLAFYGTSPVLIPGPVTVEIAATGGVVAAAEELFATAQFFEMSDEERLSKPAFLPFTAGGTLEGEAWAVSDVQTAEVVYEESLGEDQVTGPKHFRNLDVVALGWANMGAAGRAQGSISKPVIDKVAVAAPRYSVVNAETGEVVSSGAASALMASARRSVDTIAVADFELRRVS